MKPAQYRLSSIRGMFNLAVTGAVWPLLAISLLAPGCKPASPAPTPTEIAGTYTLVSVDGNKVPCTVNHDGASPTIKSGAMLINGDGTCSSKVLFTIPSRGDATREVKATYTREGNKLTMQWEGAGITSGTVEGNTFTMNNEGMVFAYSK